MRTYRRGVWQGVVAGAALSWLWSLGWGRLERMEHNEMHRVLNELVFNYESIHDGPYEQVRIYRPAGAERVPRWLEVGRNRWESRYIGTGAEVPERQLLCRAVKPEYADCIVERIVRVPQLLQGPRHEAELR